MCGARIAATGYSSRESTPDATYSPPIGARSLPPRDLGDLLSEGIDVYRSGFWTYVTIAAVPQAAFFLVAVWGEKLQLAIPLFLIGLGLYGLSFAATVIAVKQHYTRPSIDVGECFQSGLSRAMPLMGGLVIWSMALGAAAALSLVLIGLPVLVYLFVAWQFYTHAIMLEGKGAVEALGRSHQLIGGSWWRVFGIMIVFTLIVLAISVPLNLFAAVGAIISPIVSSLLSAMVGAAILPVAFITSSLLYIDLRVRREGLSLEMLEAETGPMV